jgi:hypothetical protein
MNPQTQETSTSTPLLSAMSRRSFIKRTTAAAIFTVLAFNAFRAEAAGSDHAEEKKPMVQITGFPDGHVTTTTDGREYTTFPPIASNPKTITVGEHSFVLTATITITPIGAEAPYLKEGWDFGFVCSAGLAPVAGGAPIGGPAYSHNISWYLVLEKNEYILESSYPSVPAQSANPPATVGGNSFLVTTFPTWTPPGGAPISLGPLSLSGIVSANGVESVSASCAGAATVNIQGTFQFKGPVWP